MPKFRCTREDCERVVEVYEDDQQIVRCPICGTKHDLDEVTYLDEAPDDSVEAYTSADTGSTASPDRAAAGSGSSDADTTMHVEGGATVTITIQIDIRPDGADE
jgi:hypothetical protein